MKFRKIPVVIEAYQVGSRMMRPAWLGEALSAGTVTEHQDTPRFFTITTLEGEMRADMNDWIIQGVKGELYPCKPDIFALTYEAA